MKFKTLGVAALLVLCSVSPALAGSVYVPAATDHVVEGVRYQTQVWVTNNDEDLRQFTSYFIPTESDGTERPENWGDTSAIPAGGTMLLGSVAGSGETGMLEISGAPLIVVTARMVATKDGVTGLGAAIPVISSKNLFAADTVAHNQGWVRSGDLRSDFGLVNLGPEEATCSISVFRSDGSQIQNTAVITVPPLTQRQFDDALAILGVQAISAVRSETSCDQPFYSYLRTYERITGDVFLTLPTHTIGESTLNPPGTQTPPPQSACTTPGVLCYSKPGTFFVPTVANDYRRETWNVPAGDYTKLRMRVDIVHGGWTAPSSGLHLAFWLARDGRHRNLYGFAGFKGPGSNSLLFRHGIDLEAGAKPKFTRNFQAIPGQTYKIDFVYNTSPRTLSMKLMDANGNVIHEIVDRPNVNTIHLAQGEPITADFSNVRGANPIEPPSYGWQYRNLLMELFE
jgi:hypothetical protein